MLILCDFDGTISLKDVTNAIMDHFTGPDWRATLLPDYRAGQISHFQIMSGLYGNLKTPLPELLEFSRQSTRLRSNFDQLVNFCREQNYHLAVVSGGVDFYIRQHLPPDIPFYSYLGQYDEAEQLWRVSLPDWPLVDLTAGQDFKVRVLEELRRKYPADTPAIFIGDGFNDGPVAQQADRVFAVRGSNLTKVLRGRGKPFTEFEDFAEIVNALHAER
jgi:2-hydroxy-3-keto-5-methylthiopentenyl-1-phosphate phosphatase